MAQFHANSNKLFQFIITLLIDSDSQSLEFLLFYAH